MEHATSATGLSRNRIGGPKGRWPCELCCAQAGASLGLKMASCIGLGGERSLGPLDDQQLLFAAVRPTAKMVDGGNVKIKITKTSSPSG